MFAMLLLGMLDYGKYLYVSITATEAARQGARELSQIAVGNCSAGTPVSTAISLAQGSSGAAKTYMNQIGLSSSTTVTATCLTSPVNPTWQVSLQIDYTPTLKYLLNQGLMPAGATGKTRVRASLKMRGN